MSTPDFKFLEEKPLQTAEEFSKSKFGHEEIANTLVKIIKNSPAPFTVGLFAKWGSGKSTVANSLKEKLPKENIPVVLFDVWKHEGDALRRTFLKETVRQLQEAGSEFFDKDFVLDDKLEQSVSRSSESRFTFPKEKLQQLAWPLILGIAAVAITGWAADYFGYFQFYQYFVTALFGSVTAGGLLLWLVKQSLQLFTTETVSYGADKFSDPHQFEQEFAYILCALKNPRILIIFDNLDRVMHDKVAEVLSTIKTFLEPQDVANEKHEVVFLVPCDAKAIKQHLSSVYNPADKEGVNHAFDPDEFLRKFFNTIVWIPDFIPSELESFARSCLKETGVGLLDNDYVAWIITKAFRNNPRQVIQFTNILLANYLLVEQRQGPDKDFPDGFLKDNIPQLTKYLILNQLFPEEMDVLREGKSLDLDDALSMTLQTKTSKEFTGFIIQTKNIPIHDLRTFFTLRRSEQEKKFPGFESFVALLEDQSVDDAVKYFDQLGDFSQADLVANFSQAIKEKLESKTNPVSTVNLIHTLFAVLSQKNISLTATLYEEVNNILSTRCKQELHTIPPSILNDALLIKNSNYRLGVIPQWVVVLEDIGSGANKYKSNRDFAKAVFGIFATQPDYLDASQTQKVRELLGNNFANDIDIAKTIVASPTTQEKLVSPDYIRNFTNAIPNDGGAEDIILRLGVINSLQDTLLKSAGSETFVSKFTQIQTAQNQNTKPESFPEKSKILEEFRRFISEHEPVFSASGTAVKDAFVDSLSSGFNVTSDHNLRTVFVPILFEVKKLVTSQKCIEIETLISSLVGNVKPDMLGSTLDGLAEENQNAFFDIPVLYETAANRALSDVPFREKFFARLAELRKKEFLERLLNTDFDRAFEYFESLGSKDTKYAFAIFGKVWSKFDSLTPVQKQRLFSFVNDHKANNDADIREVLATKISACLTNTDATLQQTGEEALGKAEHISKELKRRIAKESFDWVKKPEIVPKYQMHSLRAIVSQAEQFNQEEQNELVHFLFDEVVRLSLKQAHITGAFELLKELKPKYEERKQNFDDIRARIEKEENLDVKKVLVEGLYGLKPSSTNKSNVDFWTWIDSQKS
jgi:hypothetical protein